MGRDLSTRWACIIPRYPPQFPGDSLVATAGGLFAAVAAAAPLHSRYSLQQMATVHECTILSLANMQSLGVLSPTCASRAQGLISRSGHFPHPAGRKPPPTRQGLPPAGDGALTEKLTQKSCGARPPPRRGGSSNLASRPNAAPSSPLRGRLTARPPPLRCAEHQEEAPVWQGRGTPECGSHGPSR